MQDFWVRWNIYSDWVQPKIDLATKKTIQPWILKAGYTIFLQQERPCLSKVFYCHEKGNKNAMWQINDNLVSSRMIFYEDNCVVPLSPRLLVLWPLHVQCYFIGRKSRCDINFGIWHPILEHRCMFWWLNSRGCHLASKSWAVMDTALAVIWHAK